MNNEMNDTEKLLSYVKDIKFAMLTTVSPDGTIHSRPMGTLRMSVEDFDGNIWFFSKKNSFKNHDIETEQNVNLAYADPSSQKYVSVTGKAFVSQDRQKMEKLWNPILKAWFPEGLEDPEISLIGIRVETAEVWDSPSSKVVQLAGFIKASVTGKPYPEKAHSEHLDIRH